MSPALVATRNLRPVRSSAHLDALALRMRAVAHGAEEHRVELPPPR
jgi:hypothetical protein